MDNIRALIARMEFKEEGLLSIRKNNLSKSRENTVIIFSSGLILSLFFLVFVFYLLNKEIKQRAEAEREADEGRKWFSTTLTSIGDAVITTDSKGLITFMNNVAEKLTGWNYNEANGRYIEDVFNIVREADRNRVENPIKKVLAEGNIVGLTNHTILIRKDGSEIYIDDSGAPIINEENKIIGAVLIFRDISEKRHSEKEKEKLHESVRELSSFLDSVIQNANTMIFVVEGDGVVVWNDASQNITGYSKEEINNTGLKLLYKDQKYFDKVHTEAWKLVEQKGKVAGFESIINSKGGQEKTIMWNLTLLPSNSGSEKKLVVLGNDISQRKANELKINRLNKELEFKVNELKIVNEEMESFSYSVSHDLRAPIRHISGFIDLLKKNIETALDDKNKRYLQLVIDSTKEMGNLIDELLTFSRMGRKPVEVNSIDLHLIINEIISTIQSDIKQRKIKWEIPKLPVVFADPGLIKIVLTNLISNAVKYTAGKGEAVINISEYSNKDNKGNDYNVICIKDNGAGFDMKYYDKLFGIFQRLHSSEDFEGTGIGLATVKKIIQKHNGKVWAESEVDKGAAFYFSLPKY
jgi:PAS domain S-box-containing protein